MSTRSLRMNLRPGDRVDFDAITNAEQRLIETDLFTTAHVYLDMPAAEAARRMYVDVEDTIVDVHVEVSGVSTPSCRGRELTQ